MSYSDFGPLAALIGTWHGHQGEDVSPEPDGVENNAYKEFLEFEAVGDVTNAEEQQLWVVRYHQQAHRIRDDKRLHDQVGYWSWCPASNQIIQSATIPRGVSIVATGTAQVSDGNHIVFKVSADPHNVDSGITQTCFMSEHAKTTAYQFTLTINNDELNYNQSIMLDIYGKTFDHTDSNTLTRDVQFPSRGKRIV